MVSYVMILKEHEIELQVAKEIVRLHIYVDMDSGKGLSKDCHEKRREILVTFYRYTRGR